MRHVQGDSKWAERGRGTSCNTPSSIAKYYPCTLLIPLRKTTTTPKFPMLQDILPTLLNLSSPPNNTPISSDPIPQPSQLKFIFTILTTAINLTARTPHISLCLCTPGTAAHSSEYSANHIWRYLVGSIYWDNVIWPKFGLPCPFWNWVMRSW